MKQTLARALKERSRLAGRIKHNFQLLDRENSRISGSPRSFDVRAIYAESRELMEKLIAIKQRIAAANAPIAGKLVEMDELKSMISYLKGLDTTSEIKKEGYNGEAVLYEAVISAAETDAAAEELQKRVEDLQDELDEFNATTKIDLP